MCTLNNNKIQCLIDSGSQVTAISEKVYENLYKNKKLLELPVTNVMVSVAIRKKLIIINNTHLSRDSLFNQ